MRRWTATLEYRDEVGDDHVDQLPESEHDLQREQMRLGLERAMLMLRQHPDRVVSVQLFKATKAYGERRDIRRYVYIDKHGRVVSQL